MTNADELLANNAAYATAFTEGDRPRRPARQTAIVACMDSRLDIFGALGMEVGECHVIRNAGGVVTDDVIRSLVISQRYLGTREIILIHHTDCGLLTFTEDEFRAAIERDTGIRPPWAAEAFSDLEADVRQSIARIEASPFIPHRDLVRGFVFDVDSGRLREVTARE